MLSHDIVSADMAEWYTRSRYNHPYDVHLCAYTEALRLMCRFHEAVRGGVEGKRVSESEFFLSKKKPFITIPLYLILFYFLKNFYPAIIIITYL